MFFDSLFDQPRGVRGGFDPWEQQRRQALAERRAEAERRRQADMRLRREMFERERQRQADERAAQAQRSSSSSSGGGEESGEEAARRPLPPRGFPSRRPGFPWGTHPGRPAAGTALPAQQRSRGAF
ncbi:hypothetical protein DIPPA_09934 [Diplonema papillatum]|nr:hypothetical protein DIPPA_09934 [Diplonema papillatum]